MPSRAMRSPPAHEEAEVRIEEAELFRVLPEPQLRRVTPLLHQKPLLPRRPVYHEGAPAESLWVVRRGRVRLFKASSSGHVATLEELGPGRVFGALSALERETYPSSAEAVTEGVVWYLARATFQRLLAEEPSVAVEVLHIVSQRLHQAHDQLRSFAHDPAPTRLARALLRAAPEGEARVTRRALAESAGTTVETAIRVLRRLEREGLVRGEVGSVHVLDPDALRALAEQGEV